MNKLIIITISFNGMSTRLELFYPKGLENSLRIYLFAQLFLTVSVWVLKFLSSTNIFDTDLFDCLNEETESNQSQGYMTCSESMIIVLK